MDTQTLAAYEAAAARHAAYQRGIAPGPVQRLILQFFHRGAATADVGAGAGRDAAWMLGQGFRVTAYEPAAAMRAEARASFPALEVRETSLPGLYVTGFASTRDFGPFYGFTKGCASSARLVVDEMVR